jgi:hypothetical protein
MIQPERKTSIDDIKIVETRGPWASKSGGELNVLMALPQEVVAEFLDYYHPGFDTVQQRTGKNIRGLRVYNVNGIPKDSIGAMEWHDIRTECVVALGGSAVWQCVDFDGKETEVVLDGKTSVIVPPGILHTYIALEDNTRLQVICNTLFDPEDPLTHDTYSKELFTRLQKSD